MGKENRERLEDLRAINAQLQEENKHLKEKVQMFDQRMEEMEKNLETSAKLLPLLKKKFDECQDSLTTVMVDWDKHRVQLVHLGEKVIQMDSWQEDRLT
jgi:predicted nuclease with TOPRIM domain